jgi:hypothetical protein
MLAGQFMLAIALTFSASAHDRESISGLTALTNGGWVIDADGVIGNPSAGRDTIAVNTVVDYVSEQPGPAIFQYRLGFRLRDGSGVTHPIYDQDGRSNSVFYVFETVGLLSAGQTSRSHTIQLRPAAQLSWTNTYRVELALEQAQTLGGEIYEKTGVIRMDQAHTYYHFTNRSSVDIPYHAITTLDGGSYTRTYFIDMSEPGKDTFRVEIPFTVRRYDEFKSAAPPEDLIPIYLVGVLTDAETGAIIPLQSARRTVLHPFIPACDRSAAVPKPLVKNFTSTAEFRPRLGYQLNPTGKYRLALTIQHDDKSEAGAAWIDGNTLNLPPQQFLHFNGMLRFGAIETIFDSIANIPNDDGSGVPGSFVGTQLAVRNQCGFLLDGSPYSYGDGSMLQVKLLANGDAVLRTGSVTLTGPNIDLVETAGIRFKRFAPVQLTPTGGKCNLRVYLPAGIGFSLDPDSLLLDDWLEMTSTNLGPGLVPSEPVTNSQHLFFCKETLPLRVETTQTVWNPALGTFTLTPVGPATYVRAIELARLEVARLEEPEVMKFKPSNEQVFRFAGLLTNRIIVQADTNGSARWSLDLAFSPGKFLTHFPSRSLVEWSDPGRARVQADRFVPPVSYLAGIENLGVTYQRECQSTQCAAIAITGTMAVKPTAGKLSFTPDGGLAGTGLILENPELAWGALQGGAQFVHQTTAFETASFHMPGSTLRGDASALDLALRPGVLLLTGVDTDTHNSTERPFTVAYAAGFGDYAGLNLRVREEQVKSSSVLAGSSLLGPYTLAANSKYYIRQGGVSGIHQARMGSDPLTVPLYRYPAWFDSFGLSYLDSNNQVSRTAGRLAVPEPAGFTIPFEELRFTCLGDLDQARLASSGTTNHLIYWNADFMPHTIQFRRDPKQACTPGTGWLVLGLTTYGSHIAEPLYGTVGFKPDGNILTRADGLLEGVDSRLHLPKTLSLAGPANVPYRLSPSTLAYFNNHDFAPSPAVPVGWLNLFGTLDLPFFENMSVHLQTSTIRGSTNAPVYFMGGWIDAKGKTFDTYSHFDSAHQAYPTNTTLAAYRNPVNETDQVFRPHARQRLLQTVPLDYALTWNSATRSFKSAAVAHNPLLLLEVKHQVKYLTSHDVELAFGAQYDGLPRLNLANLAVNALEGGGGIATALTGVLEPLGHQRLVQGFAGLNRIMAEQLDALLESPLNQALNPTVDGLEAALRQRFSTLSPEEDWTRIAEELIDGYVDGTGSQGVVEHLRQQLPRLVTKRGGQSSFLGAHLGIELGQVIEGIDAMAGVPGAAHPQGLLSAGSGGARDAARNLAGALIRQLAPEQEGGSLDDILGSLLQRAEPTLAQVVATLQGYRAELDQTRQSLSGELEAELAAAVSGGDFDGITDLIKSDLKRAVRTIDFGEYSATDLKTQWRRRMQQRFLTSALPGRLQRILRSRFYDLDSGIRQAVDSGFQQINQIMEDAVSSSLALLDRHLDSFLGDLQEVMAGGQIDGYARINGDTVPELRLNGKFQWRVPDPLEFRGYLRILQQSSSSDGGGCYAPGAKVTEVVVGAEDVAIDWIGDGIRANLGAKFSFATRPSLRPVGLGGWFNQTAGTIRFESAAVRKLAAGLAFGAQENYLSGRAALDLSGYSVEGGMFFGRTCDLAPIEMIDPDVASILGAPSPTFTGAYIYGEGEMPIVDYGCAFNISAGVGAGIFYFAEGPTYGGKMMAKISGEALCLISVHGKIEMIGAKRGDDLTFRGKGRVKGKVGWCPFCKRFRKTVTLTYKNREWDADY